MSHYDKNGCITKLDYIAVEGNELFRMRDCKDYSEATIATSNLPSFAAPRLDGQGLAGTGALVFEGELLVLH